MSRQIAVIGLGLIGGSIAMGLKEFEDFKRVGVDVSQPTLRYALEQGIVDQVCEDPREALAQADLVFLCMHPRGIQEFLSEHRDHFRPGSLVTDVCGVKGAIVPLIVSAAPFIARMVETSLAEVESGVVEAAQSMGASTFQIIWKVILPESLPGLVGGFVTALITILGYGSMAGFIGGGGLGKIAVNYGYNKFNYGVMFVAVVLIVVLVQLFQSIGTHIAVSLDHRLTDRSGRRRGRKAVSSSVRDDKDTPGTMG